MAIDQMLLGSMLDPFKNMAEDCKSKGYSGESFDKMMAALERMEQLGAELSDFMEYSAKISAEGLQMAFSNACGQLLADAASKQQSTANKGGYDDAALLKQNLDALKQAVIELKKAEETAIAEAGAAFTDSKKQAVAANEIRTLTKSEQLIKPIEDLIAYGESGVNFPTFLRVQIEKGLDKAMEGSGLVRDGVIYEHGFARASSINPYSIKIKEEQLNAFDQLKALSPFDVPNSLSVQLKFNEIEAQYVSEISKWTTIDNAWMKLFSLLDTWVIAHTKFAPFIDPWAMSRDPKAAVLRDKETLPGIIAERVRLLGENYNVNFADVRSHETFIWSVKNHHFPYSQIYTNLMLDAALPICKPGQFLPADIIDEVERLYNNKEMHNPENYRVLDRQEGVYNTYFGSDMFVQKFGPKPHFDERNAQPWSIM